MRRFSLIALLALIASPVYPATLTFTITPSPNNNAGTCSAPVLVAASDSVMLRWSIVGPAYSKADSLYTNRVPRTINYNVTNYGSYAVSATELRKSTTSGLWLIACAPKNANIIIQDTTIPDTVTLSCPNCP